MKGSWSKKIMSVKEEEKEGQCLTPESDGVV